MNQHSACVLAVEDPNPRSPQVIDAQVPYSRGFRPLPSALLRHLSLLACVYTLIETPAIFGSMGPALRPWTTMASADFCASIAPPLDGTGPFGQTHRSPRVLRCNFPPTYPSHLHTHLPGDIGLCIAWPARPDVHASYALPVRRAGSLHSASSTHHLAMMPPESFRDGSCHQGTQGSCTS